MEKFWKEMFEKSIYENLIKQVEENGCADLTLNYLNLEIDSFLLRENKHLGNTYRYEWKINIPPFWQFKRIDKSLIKGTSDKIEDVCKISIINFLNICERFYHAKKEIDNDKIIGLRKPEKSN